MLGDSFSSSSNCPFLDLSVGMFGLVEIRLSVFDLSVIKLVIQRTGLVVKKRKKKGFDLREVQLKRFSLKRVLMHITVYKGTSVATSNAH